ncbi:MAG: phage tail tip lysozyme [Streptosporangiales bacterium]
MKAAGSKARKIRKSGRHAAPSQVQKAAQRAGRAAPAVAVVGALTASGASALASAAPASAATQVAATLRGPAGQVLRARPGAATRAHQRRAARQARQAAGSYTVHTGDTLSGIAQRFYGHASDWPYLYHVNDAKISDPNLIYTGQVLRVPGNPPASVLNGTYQPRHASPSSGTATTAVRSTPDSDQAAASPGSQAGASSSSASQSSAAQAPTSSAPATVTSSSGHACTGSGGAMLPENYGAIVTFLTAHGYSGNAAAGIAGNIWQESGGNPESVGDGGGGLIGWTPLPGGYVTGNPAADLQTQLNAILTFNQIWAQYIPALNAAGSPAQAADIYVTDFERAGIPAAANREAAASAVAAACGL